jgi:glycosyltransferase involved in cell wall biosynthesis
MGVPPNSLALVVTTYERPEALAAVFASIARQSRMPDEIVVADDGSSQAARAITASLIAQAPAAAREISQPHEGFRVARLRNLAIAAVKADYVVCIDGDMLLHPEFIADHVRHARIGHYTQGVRVRTDAILTADLIDAPARFPGALESGLGVLRRAYLLHSPGMQRACLRVANHLVSIKSCNQAFWREDLVRVNGFNEDIVGWGPEDKELCVRLENAGVRRQTLLFGGIACHLHHAPASRASLPRNRAILGETRRQRRVRCEHGLDSHLRA